MDRREIYDKMRQWMEDGKLFIPPTVIEEPPRYLTDSELALAYALSHTEKES